MRLEKAEGVFSKILEEKSLDLILINKMVNIRYLTGFTGTSGYLFYSKEGFLFLTDPRYTEQARKECSGVEVEEIRGEKLSDWIEKRFSPKRMGIEQWMSVGALERLKEGLKNVEVEVLLDLVEDLRVSKDSEEKERIKKALELAEESFTEVLDLFKPGVRERDIALELEWRMRRKGSTGVSFSIIVASGSRSAMPHGVASEKPIERGDLVIVDWGCVFDGYCSDITRVVKLGRLSGDEKRIWSAVYDAHMRAVEAVASGERDCKKIHRVAHSVFDEIGLGDRFGHGLGHGVGLEIHEKPSLSPLSEDKLATGAVFTVEPGIYLPGEFGIRLENIYYLDETPVCLNSLPLDVFEL